MVNPIVKAWKHAMAKVDVEVENNADPKVQIEQAIAEAKRQHQVLSQQAAAVIGNQHQLEIKLNRHLSDLEKTRNNVRQALLMAEEAREQGHHQRAYEYEAAAANFSAQLVTAENNIQDLKGLYDQATVAAMQAKEAVERNTHILEQQLAERTRLLNQLDQTIMQERVAGAVQHFATQDSASAAPTLDQVREKIEQRYARAVGATELAGGPVTDRMAEIEARAAHMPSTAKLAEIKQEMQARGELSSGTGHVTRPEITAE